MIQLRKSLAIVTCKCGSIVDACVLPHGRYSRKWRESVRDHEKKGRRVETCRTSTIRFTKCVCKDIERMHKTQLKLDI